VLTDIKTDSYGASRILKQTLLSALYFLMLHFSAMQSIILGSLLQIYNEPDNKVVGSTICRTTLHIGMCETLVDIFCTLDSDNCNAVVMLVMYFVIVGKNQSEIKLS